MRILIAEDEIKINTIVEESLQKEGYTVDAVMDGKYAISFFNIHHYDLIILDLMMPEINGEDVMKYIRNKDKSIPIIALTAKSDTDSIVKNLDNGFDDYITKPFKMEELKARIRTILRRNSTNEVLLTSNNITLDPFSKIVKCKDEVIPLTLKEYAILEYLLRNKDKFKSEEEIFDNVWEHDAIVGSNVIAAHIKNLKRKINKSDSNQNLIKSQRGKGYIIYS